MPTNFKVSSDIDSFLRKATKEEAAAFLVGATYAPINNPTFTGTVGIPTADFNVGNAGGEVSWNDTEKTLDLVTGADDVTIQIGQETVLFARNNSGVQINNGECVMLTGSVGNKPAISKGDASNSVSAHRIIGIATQDIANNSEGYVTLVGKVRGINLPNEGFNEGDVVYADPTVAGGLTTTKPDIEVELGIVLKAGGNGQIEVNTNNEAALYDLEQELTESGSFSPRLETGDGTIVQNDYLINNSTYVRVGRLVFINVNISISNFNSQMKATNKDWRLTGLPFVSQGDTHVEIRPFRGWLDLGEKNITGFIGAANDYMWFEYFKDGGTVAGLGNSLTRVNQTEFVNPPFDFTNGSFDFLVTGVYKTNDDPSV